MLNLFLYTLPLVIEIHFEINPFLKYIGCVANHKKSRSNLLINKKIITLTWWYSAMWLCILLCYIVISLFPWAWLHLSCLGPNHISLSLTLIILFCPFYVSLCRTQSFLHCDFLVSLSQISWIFYCPILLSLSLTKYKLLCSTCSIIIL